MSLEERLSRLAAANDTLGTGKVTRDSDGAKIEDVVVAEADQEAAFSEIFERFSLSPNEYSIVDDSVTCKTWQAANGEWRFSYGAKLVKGTASSEVSPETFEAWRENLRAFQPELLDATPNGTGTYVILLADPQLGKLRTDEAVENWKRGITAHVARIWNLISAERAPGKIHLAFMGDEHEGVANHYTNQPFTIELNRTQQFELDFDLRVWTIRELSSIGLPLSVSSVISNHGEWTRNGTKDPVTTQNDNSSTYISRQVKKLFDELQPHTGLDITWTIGDKYPGITLDLDGVKAYFTHGYIEKGRSTGGTEAKVKAAMERQILGRTEDLGDVKLFFTAHYHHFHSQEFEGRTLFGCPALEAERSSEYMQNQFGIWSPPGLLGVHVDPTASRGWRDLAIF